LSDAGADPSERIPFHSASIGQAERQAVLDVLNSGWLTTGQRVLDFEAAIERELTVQYAVAVNSATSALHLALEALGVGPADEVIVPTYTFAASGEVVRYLGARPRLADIDPVTLNATAETLEAQVRPNTKAVMIVHFGGLVADMEPILDLARRRRLAVVEDAAHALPASRAGRAAGTFGEAGALSFYATKPVTTGEGGMLVTDDPRIAERARVMRLHGISRDAWRRYSASGSWFYEIEDVGFKYNLTDIAAAMGVVQLARAEGMRRQRERVAARYAALLDEAGLLDLLELPPPAPPGDVHSWHLYPIRLHLDRLSIGRASVIEVLAASGIGTSVHFIPLHLHPYYRRTYGYAPTDLPNASAEYEREISLPIYPDLDDRQIGRVVEALSEVLTSARAGSAV
jgi:dTDP-4-amino-4,6-dideoxygalactose transaminase